MKASPRSGRRSNHITLGSYQITTTRSDVVEHRAPFVVHYHYQLARTTADACREGVELTALCGFRRVPVLPLPACRIRCPQCKRIAVEMNLTEVAR